MCTGKPDLLDVLAARQCDVGRQREQRRPERPADLVDRKGVQGDVNRVVQAHVVEGEKLVDPRRRIKWIADVANGVPDAKAADADRIVASGAEARQRVDIAIMIGLPVDLPRFIDRKIAVLSGDAKQRRETGEAARFKGAARKAE